MLGLTLKARRRSHSLVAAAVIATLYLLYMWTSDSAYSAASPWSYPSLLPQPATPDHWQMPDDYFWRTVPVHNPPTSIRPLPTGKIVSYPSIQASKFPASTLERDEHRQAVKQVFLRCWRSYKDKAWLSDELAPLNGGRKNPFGGWGATLVDALDTLWIMDLRDEFQEAVAAAATIDFTQSQLSHVNVFETTIRYLGGFLAAYDLSGDTRLLRKAVEVGEMLYKAFDTPNRMPITRWSFVAAAEGERQVADDTVLLAEIGSLCMEFTRLSLVTGEPKWFDATQRITEALLKAQDSTSLAGMWPLTVDAREGVFDHGTHFTLGSMADSTYEYLPKMAALLGGTLPEYQTMYEKAMDTASQFLLFRPMTPDNADILFSGTVHTQTQGFKTFVSPEHEAQHLSCFAGGMYALGGRMFGREQDMDRAARLTEGCIWAYRASKHGVMPETFRFAPCADGDGSCEWDERAWKRKVVADAGETLSGDTKEDVARADQIIKDERLRAGFTAIGSRFYALRPEAIESVFVLYRATGRADLLDTAWRMFTAIDGMTSTRFANSAVGDVTTSGKPGASDAMESFWMGETLKYFYLMFSDESLISLDEWVFNTEAHPFKRLVR